MCKRTILRANVKAVVGMRVKGTGRVVCGEFGVNRLCLLGDTDCEGVHHNSEKNTVCMDSRVCILRVS